MFRLSVRFVVETGQAAEPRFIKYLDLIHHPQEILT
jgi:hypothetical protein